MEMLEAVLMRAFLVIYSSECDGGDDDDSPYKSGKSRSSESPAFTVLSSVCWYWRQTLCGWQQSPTGHWVRHKLKKLIECKCSKLIQASFIAVYRIERECSLS